MKKYCKNCGKLLTIEQRHNIYCSKKCQIIYQKNQKVQDWLNGEVDGLTGADGQMSQVVRNYMLEQSNYSCELCGWHEINPFTNKIPLEIHHIDGNHLNNAKDNLQILCPNCHSLTGNYKSLNTSTRQRTQTRKNYCVDCGKEITANACRCIECSNKNRITIKPLTKEELKMKIRTMPFTTIAAECNVSDNAVRKWCISYGLPSKKKDILAYSDEEWELI